MFDKFVKRAYKNGSFGLYCDITILEKRLDDLNAKMYNKLVEYNIDIKPDYTFGDYINNWTLNIKGTYKTKYIGIDACNIKVLYNACRYFTYTTLENTTADGVLANIDIFKKYHRGAILATVLTSTHLKLMGMTDDKIDKFFGTIVEHIVLCNNIGDIDMVDPYDDYIFLPNLYILLSILMIQSNRIMGADELLLACLLYRHFLNNKRIIKVEDYKDIVINDTYDIIRYCEYPMGGMVCDDGS